MVQDFCSFLEQFTDGNIIEYWRESMLDKVEIYKHDKLWRLFVEITQPVLASVIDETAQICKRKNQFLDRVDIIPLVKPGCQKVLQTIAETRREELVGFLTDDGRKSDMPQGISWQVDDNRLDLLLKDTRLYESIIARDVCTRLSEWIWQQYYLRVVVRAKYSINTHARPSETVFIVKKNVEVIKNDDNQGTDEKRYGKRERKQREQIINHEPIPLKDVEEGLKTAVVEGEIWNKDASVLRDGRLVVTYYLTDYTDTILLKSFLDSQEDEKIMIGDWIKAKGSTRYDSFAKEIVLYLEAFSHVDKPERKDTCPQKRIELHAHTKMSAMDSLTEIKDLIKKASQWGHEAIAITDHGCVQAFPQAYAAARQYQIKIIYGVEGYLNSEEKKKPFHIILLAADLQGLKNLYKLISISYLDNYYRVPRMNREDLQKYRQGILLGTACEAGELYQAIIDGQDEASLEAIASFYDYLEIQPVENNAFLLREGRVKSEEQLRDINRYIIKLGDKLGKPVVATGDVHFLEPYHEVFRRIIQSGQGYDDAETQAPLYFRTTDEMLTEFAYLGDEQARAVVIENPRRICEQIDTLKPVPDGFYPPKIAAAEEEITKLAWERAHQIYGDKLPEIVEARLTRELEAITKHGFSVLYLIAHKLVKKSNDDGYLVGSRGSVGSSLVAHFTGITEVNPLPPHYICNRCFYSEFILDGSVGCGADLEDRACPVCSQLLKKDGFDIPFETFLGFEGDKIPDIDLNFSGEYQGRAHKYVEELFGSQNVFRAGTISTIAEKTAFGFVKKYAEEKQIDIKNSEINRLTRGIAGVRRTTGQHPGGLIVVPTDKDIREFTPLQYPADKKESGVITTHFEYHAIGDQLVKLDILGHDDPTVIKHLEDTTGVKASSISLSDPDTMKLFSGVEPLGVTSEAIDSTVGTYGIPEFGTRFVRQMLEVTRPTTFSELVRISGLSHGTDVWLNNAQTLIEAHTATLNEVICTRDDIMTFLIQTGMDKKQAFKIMENVRKGKGLNDDQIAVMKECQVPDWYIDSCQKIKYMFPKAHAVAYVTMAFRIAYFKINYPLQFYASFFGIRAEDFDAETILAGYDAIRQRIKDIDKMGNSASAKDKKLITILELAMEMSARGFTFYPVDIYTSDAQKFNVVDNGLVLPFCALPNVGVSAAQNIVAARQEAQFVSIEDFQSRTGLNKTAMETLRQNGCFQGIPESTQISLFG
ncbi:MAG: PolC-type DNA polymerase III [Syntrophomonadaceae bacterium]